MITRADPHKLPIVLIRGGGDLASGVALRLHRVGIRLVITELAKPLAVRRLVSFSEAVYLGRIKIEGVTGSCVKNSDEVRQTLMRREVPVVVDPECQFLNETGFDVFTLIDARMIKQPPDLGLDAASLVVGLGPGFEATVNCDAVIETNRGHNLGRVIWKGSPESDTGVPGLLGDKGRDRVLRAPANGIIRNKVRIGTIVKRGQIIAEVGEEAIYAPYGGLLRGLIHDNFSVRKNMKIGDLDPRKNRVYAVTVSDKSMAVAGGVLEALLSRSDIRYKLWS